MLRFNCSTSAPYCASYRFAAEYTNKQENPITINEATVTKVEWDETPSRYSVRCERPPAKALQSSPSRRGTQPLRINGWGKIPLEDGDNVNIDMISWQRTVGSTFERQTVTLLRNGPHKGSSAGSADSTDPQAIEA